MTAFIFTFLFVKAQDRPVHPSSIVTGTFIGVSKPLRDLPKISQQEFNRLAEKAKTKQLNERLKLRSYPFASSALPKGPDPAWQQSMGTSSGNRAPIKNFDGQDSPYYPPDCNGAVGPAHYMQTINCIYSIYDKNGTSVAGPTAMNLLFGSVPGATYNDGDPVLLYDEQADRWVATEFSISGATDYILMAVSKTNDPTGQWYQYSFVVASMPDYPKFGVWRDGYYMGDNNSSGKDIYVFQRSQMLIGGTALSIGFDNPYRPTSVDGFMMVPPVDNDGALAPAGSPGTFIAFNDDAVGGGNDELWIYELTADWTTPANSTFGRVQQIPVAAFSSDFGTGWDNIPQSGTTQKVDAIPQVIMNVPQYRNFGTYQTIVCCHTVDVDGTDHAGIRWYELRRATQTSGNWVVRQQGTYAPDAYNRWMGSIMLNGSGRIGLGYSISSSSLFPGIRYCGQSSSAYNSATGVLDIPEEIIHTGAYSQSSYNRWGDYSDLSIDPTDDNTFWFTTEYIGSGGARKTKIASFKFGNNPAVVTLAATSVTGTSATLNGTVNPNGLATTFHFEWGTSTSYGNSTTLTGAGSGTSNVAASVALTSLTGGTTYHFRLVAVNSDGTTYGNDLTFIPGGAAVTTSVVTSITASSATSGGNVSSDGGSAVTARGICWSTSANPSIAGSHTTDGSGLGVFTSPITALSANTAYHVRAYATNGNGTYYGDDIQFTTLCGISTLPLTENFTGASLPNCWSTQISGTGGVDKWTVSVTTNAGGTANEMKSTWQSVNPGTTRLITPPINTSGMTQLNLSFKHYLDAYAAGVTLRVQSSTDKITWTDEAWSLVSTATNVGPATVNTTVTSNLNSAATYIAFVVIGDLYQYDYWYIDDVSIVSNVPTLTVTPADRPVTALGGSTVFSVSSPSAWTASSNQTWCTVTPSGTGNGTLTATYSTNNTGSGRVASITVTAAGLTPQVVTVTQAAPTLTVTPANKSVLFTAGATSFTVTSNSSWTSTSNQTWCTVTPSGTGNGTLTATYTENTTYSARIANISVVTPGLPAVVVTVTQAAGTPPELNYTIVNDVQTSDRTLEFDLYLLDAQTVTPLELSMIQTGILVNSGIINGGTITPSIIPGTSELLTAEQPNSIEWKTGSPAGCIKIAARPLPGCGYGTIISTSGLGTRICRLRITNSVPFTAGSQANMAFCFTATPFLITKVFQYTGTPCASVQMTTSTTNCFSLATNPILNGPPSLSVSPSDRPVTSSAGTTSFTVTSNAAWTATSNQLWCSVTPSGFGSGTITANYAENTSASPRVASITVSVAGLSPIIVRVTQDGVTSKTLNISSLFLEGLYNGYGTMFQAQDALYDEFGNITGVIPKWTDGSADHISVELHSSIWRFDPACSCDTSDYPTIVYAATGVPLTTSGTATLSIPVENNGAYYLTIKHRNSLETTSALPVDFSGATINYDFTPASQAFDANMTTMIEADETVSPPLIFSGDVNQDGQVEAEDLNMVGNDATLFAYGYLTTDVYGDGQIEAQDLNITGNNAATFVYKHVPQY